MGAWRAAALATEFGFAVVGSLVGGIVLGLYLDRRLGTSPGLFIVGLVGGLLFSIYLIYAIYRVQMRPRGAESESAGTTAGAGGAASGRAEEPESARARSTH